jgi:hypothetical protein
MAAYPVTQKLQSVTVILPVMNETYSLTQTVEEIIQTSRPDLLEFIVVVAPETLPESRSEVAALVTRFGDLIVVHEQKLRFLGGAMREAFGIARGSHTIMMASDLETDPALVPVLIGHARHSPAGIVTVTRWRKGGGFEGYNPIKLLANAAFQLAFSLLYWTRLTDMTYAYRVFPTALIQAIEWEELRHPFLFETIIKPLRLGVSVIEIPGRWRARTEGSSQNTFLRNFEYFRIGFRVRFSPLKSLLRGQ